MLGFRLQLHMRWLERPVMQSNDTSLARWLTPVANTRMKKNLSTRSNMSCYAKEDWSKEWPMSFYASSSTWIYSRLSQCHWLIPKAFTCRSLQEKENGIFPSRRCIRHSEYDSWSIVLPVFLAVVLGNSREQEIQSLEHQRQLINGAGDPKLTLIVMKKSSHCSIAMETLDFPASAGKRRTMPFYSLIFSMFFRIRSNL